MEVPQKLLVNPSLNTQCEDIGKKCWKGYRRKKGYGKHSTAKGSCVKVKRKRKRRKR